MNRILLLAVAVTLIAGAAEARMVCRDHHRHIIRCPRIVAARHPLAPPHLIGTPHPGYR
jgi:hypothetical protein